VPTQQAIPEARCSSWLARKEYASSLTLTLALGLPAQGNVHKIARDVNRDARVLYVDNDAVVVSHAQALLADASLNGL
jgi:hypothetical protein